MLDHHISHPAGGGAPAPLYTIRVSLGNASSTARTNTNIMDDPADATEQALVDTDGNSIPITATCIPNNAFGKFDDGYVTGDESGDCSDAELKSHWLSGNNSVWRGVRFSSIPDGYWFSTRAICSHTTASAITNLRTTGLGGSTTVQNIGTESNKIFSLAMDVEEDSGVISVEVKEDAAANFNCYISFIEIDVWDQEPV